MCEPPPQNIFSLLFCSVTRVYFETLKTQRHRSAVFRLQVMSVIISSFTVTHFEEHMCSIINTFGSFVCVSLCACLVFVATQWEKWRKLCPPTISVSTSSVWIPSELNPWPFPCPRAWVLPSHCRPSSWVRLTCELRFASEATLHKGFIGEKKTRQKVSPLC